MHKYYRDLGWDCYWSISSLFDSYLPATCQCYRFLRINSVRINGFSQNLVCALVLWRSAFGLLQDKFCCVSFGQLSARDVSVFLSQDNNLSKSQWIFTKLDICIDIVEIVFGIANVQINLCDRVICPQYGNSSVFLFDVFVLNYFSEKIKKLYFMWIVHWNALFSPKNAKIFLSD